MRVGWRWRAAGAGLAAVALVAGLSGCDGTARASSAPAAPGGGATTTSAAQDSVVVANQTSTGTSVVVRAVTVAHPGEYLAVARAAADGIGQVVGYTAVAPGTSRQVVVRFARPLTSGKYWFLIVPGPAPTKIRQVRAHALATVVVSPEASPSPS